MTYKSKAASIKSNDELKSPYYKQHLKEGEMITIEEAYRTIKKGLVFPITFMIETDDYFLTTTDRYLAVNKTSGKQKEYTNYGDFMVLASEGKHVLPDNMLYDYLMFYQNHTEDRYLAELYARAANRLFYHSYENPAMYSTELNQRRFCDEWAKIEKLLFTDIIERIKSEIISSPPCVHNNPDDPYYIVKPFMLRNGWTTNDVNRTWVKTRT